MPPNHPKNLEIDFNNLSINPSWKKTNTSGHHCNLCKDNRKNHIFKNILVTPNCNCKISKKRHKSPIVRPAKLNLPTNRKNSKLFVLKPPTLNILDDESATKSNTSRTTVLQNTSSVISISKGKVLSDGKLYSQSSFKSLLPIADNDILKAFDTLSFKELRTQSTKCAKKSTNNQTHENSNSCSVQARMESLPTDGDDVSIEELASYFDLFVHIPKKMSSMAEMMYI